MRDGFLLDPDVVYLNHGGYGACPVVVFEEYQRWQRELERHGWQRTNDAAAYLAVPKAIEVHAMFDLEASAALADKAERRLAVLRLKTLRGGSCASPSARTTTSPTSTDLSQRSKTFL